MPFAITENDLNIIKKVKLTYTPPTPVNGWFDDLASDVSGSRTVNIGNSALGSILGESATITIDNVPIGKSSEIPIQFPPRIKSKNKTSNWILEDKASYEPEAVFQGSDATKITLELKYLVTGGKWGIETIAKSVHTIMGYFYRTVQEGANGAPLVQVILYEICPDKPEVSTWRLDDASITYSDELVQQNGLVYPQLVTATLSLSMLTKIGDSTGNYKQNLTLAADFPKKEWY